MTRRTRCPQYLANTRRPSQVSCHGQILHAHVFRCTQCSSRSSTVAHFRLTRPHSNYQNSHLICLTSFHMHHLDDSDSSSTFILVVLHRPPHRHTPSTFVTSTGADAAVTLSAVVAISTEQGATIDGWRFDPRRSTNLRAGPSFLRSFGAPSP